jgi:hypothetical protein
MAIPLASQRWAVALGVGIIVCVIVLIVALHGYSLKLHSGLIDLEMHPASPQASAAPR